MVFKITQKVTNIWAPIVRKFAGKNFENFPNLVTLLVTYKKILINDFRHYLPNGITQIGTSIYK